MAMSGMAHSRWFESTSLTPSWGAHRFTISTLASRRMASSGPLSSTRKTFRSPERGHRDARSRRSSHEGLSRLREFVDRVRWPADPIDCFVQSAVDGVRRLQQLQQRGAEIPRSIPGRHGTDGVRDSHTRFRHSVGTTGRLDHRSRGNRPGEQRGVLLTLLAMHGSDGPHRLRVRAVGTTRT
jgi:hypothetical protein